MVMHKSETCPPAPAWNYYLVADTVIGSESSPRVVQTNDLSSLLE